MNALAEPVSLAEPCRLEDADATAEPAGTATTLELIELTLKQPQRLDRLIRHAGSRQAILPRLLAIALIGFIGFGVAMAAMLSIARTWPVLSPLEEYLSGRTGVLIHFEAIAGGLTPWIDGSAWRLMAAYSFGLIAAVGVCLPSFYFLGLLAGVRLSMAEVVAQSVKGQATSAIALVGILPIYAALVLAVFILPSEPELIERLLKLGLALPFIAGLAGVRSLYVSLLGMADMLPAESRCRRACFLRRLLVSWCLLYTAVSPVMIHTVWRQLAAF